MMNRKVTMVVMLFFFLFISVAYMYDGDVNAEELIDERRRRKNDAYLQMTYIYSLFLSDVLFFRT